MTPYILNHLGKEEFGIWALMTLFSYFAQITDFGIADSLVKFVAEFQVRDDRERINQLVNTAFVVYSLISMACIILFFSTADLIVGRFLNIPEALHIKAKYALNISIIVFCINLIIGIFTSIFVGFQRFEFSSILSTCSILLSAAGTFIVLTNGLGLIGLVYNSLVISIIMLIASAIVSKCLFNDLSIRFIHYFQVDILMMIIRFGSRVQITNLTQLFIFQIDKILISHYFGLAALSNYEVANRLALQFRSLIASMFAPMIPAASALHAMHEHSRVTSLYRRSFKYMAIIVIPFSSIVIALAHPFVKAWVGSGYDISAWTLQLLMVAFVVNLLTGPGSFILSGINKPQMSMRSSVLAGILNPICCLVFIRWIGYYGVPIGMLTSLLISTAYFVALVHSSIPGLGWHIYGDILTRPLALSVVLCLIVHMLSYLFPLDSFLLLAILGTIYSVVVCIGISYGGYLDDFDHNLIARSFIFRFVRHVFPSPKH